MLFLREYNIQEDVNGLKSQSRERDTSSAALHFLTDSNSPTGYRVGGPTSVSVPTPCSPATHIAQRT